jgi:hypothetical protein
VIAHTYRGAYVAAVQRQQNHWDACIRLARHIPDRHVARPWSLDRLDEIGELLLEHAGSLMSAIRLALSVEAGRPLDKTLGNHLFEKPPKPGRAQVSTSLRNG